MDYEDKPFSYNEEEEMNYEDEPFSYNEQEEEEMDYEDEEDYEGKPLYYYMNRIYGGFFTDYYLEKNYLINHCVVVVAKNTRPPLEHDFDEEGNYVPFPFSNLTFPKQFVKEVRLVVDCSRLKSDDIITIRCPRYEELNRVVNEKFW